MKNHLLKIFLFSILVPVFVQAQEHRGNTHGGLPHQHRGLPVTYFDPARSISGNGANINVVYHRINWRINPDSALKGIKGTIMTYFRTTAANVSSITFDMNTVALTVSQARFRGANLPGANIVESGNTLTINLGTTIAAIGTLDSIELNYAGAPPNPSGASIGYVKTTRATGRNVIYTVSQPFEDRDWWICKQDITDKIDSMDIYINVPNTFKAASNGRLMSVTASGLNSIYHWRHRYAIPSYLVCVGVADYVEYLGPSVNVSGTMVPMQHYLYPPQNTATVQGYCNMVGQALDTFSNYFGDYPYKNEKYGQYQMTSFGGMEHATFSAMSTSALTSWSTSIHELGHQWFGDKVTCATFNHIWLNEGLTTYTEIFGAEKVPNALIGSLATERSATKTTARGTTASPYLTTALTTNDIFGGSTTDIYARGAMVASMLRLILGDDKFYLALRNYLNDPANAYGPVTTDDLKFHMEAVSGLSLTEFFNDWVYGQGNCSYDVTWGVLSKTISLQLTQTSDVGTGFVTHFDTPLPIKILGAGVDTTVIIFDRNGVLSTAGARNPSAITTSNIIRIPLSFVPTGIQIDPDNLSLAGVGSATANNTLALNEMDLSGTREASYNNIRLAAAKQWPAPAYILEFSEDGLQFTDAGNMQSVATDANYNYFELRHYNRRTVNYYRVKTRDLNGAWKYSNTVKITVDKKNRLTILTNPVVNGRLNLSIPDDAGNAEISIAAASGKTMLSQKVQAGVSVISNIDISHLDAGYYVVWLKAQDGRVYAEKLIVGR
jgi:hypothetical protein